MKRKGLIFLILLFFNFFFIYGINYANLLMFNNNFMLYIKGKEPAVEIEKQDAPEEVVDTSFNGESMEDIGTKLDKVWTKTDLGGYGEYVAKVSISKGVNPYLIGAIIMESTYCKADCTILFKKCNNVAGIKGSPGCFGGTYKEYYSVNDSINELVNKISNDYYTTEMQVPYKMYSSYGKTAVWAFKVNKYMEQLKRGK